MPPILFLTKYHPMKTTDQKARLAAAKRRYYLKNRAMYAAWRRRWEQENKAKRSEIMRAYYLRRTGKAPALTAEQGMPAGEG